MLGALVVVAGKTQVAIVLLAPSSPAGLWTFAMDSSLRTSCHVCRTTITRTECVSGHYGAWFKCVLW